MHHRHQMLERHLEARFRCPSGSFLHVHPLKGLSPGGRWPLQTPADHPHGTEAVHQKMRRASTSLSMAVVRSTKQGFLSIPSRLGPHAPLCKSAGDAIVIQNESVLSLGGRIWKNQKETSKQPRRFIRMPTTKDWTNWTEVERYEQSLWTNCGLQVATYCWCIKLTMDTYHLKLQSFNHMTRDNSIPLSPTLVTGFRRGHKKHGPGAMTVQDLQWSRIRKVAFHPWFLAGFQAFRTQNVISYASTKKMAVQRKICQKGCHCQIQLHWIKFGMTFVHSRLCNFRTCRGPDALQIVNGKKWPQCWINCTCPTRTQACSTNFNSFDMAVGTLDVPCHSNRQFGNRHSFHCYLNQVKMIARLLGILMRHVVKTCVFFMIVYFKDK